VLGGRPTVFLSCSEKYKATVAVQLRSELAKRAVFGVIVSEEPLPAGVGWEPDAKVDWYLNDRQTSAGDELREQADTGTLDHMSASEHPDWNEWSRRPYVVEIDRQCCPSSSNLSHERHGRPNAGDASVNSSR
jgi:hypothetical protein